MPVKETPVTYQSHGKTFNTKEEAERFDKLYDARVALEEAQKRFEQALGKSCFTADGYPFRFGLYDGYWRVVETWGSPPCLEKLCYAWSWAVREDGETVEIKSKDDEPGRVSRYHPINTLYYQKTNAEKAALAAQRAWLVEQQKAVDEFESKMGS